MEEKFISFLSYSKKFFIKITNDQRLCIIYDNIELKIKEGKSDNAAYIKKKLDGHFDMEIELSRGLRGENEHFSISPTQTSDNVSGFLSECHKTSITDAIIPATVANSAPVSVYLVFVTFAVIK